MLRNGLALRSQALLALLVALALQPCLASEEKEVFDPGTVLRFRIELSEEAIAQLRADPRTFVRGTVREGDRVYGDVGVRVKGSIGSRRSIDEKPGLTLKFNRFVPGQRFHGLRKLILNNSAQDPTYLTELFGNELFRSAGVPAPRISLATVELNGRRLGLYVVAEAVTRDFLGRWFKDTSGNLYEGPGDVTSGRLDVDSPGTSNRLDLRELIEAAREPETAKRMEGLEKVLDVDRFISFLAVEAITCHWDGYMTGTNNYRLYHDPSTKRMVFIPHGADQLFQNVNAPIHPQARGLVAQAVLKTAAGRKRYRERLKALVETIFDVGRLQNRIAELQAKILPFLKDEGLGARFAQAGAVQGLTWRISERARSLREQLEGKVAAPAGPALAFEEDGRARLTGFQPRIMGGNPRFQRAKGEGVEGKTALKVTVGEGGECRASWRKRVFLPPGRYRFAGRIRTQGVAPAENSMPDGGRSGADFRISGDQPRSKLLGDNDWTPYEFNFEIEPEEGWEGEQPVTPVELVCELEASRGVAWFDEDSLELRRSRVKGAESSSGPIGP